jgi:hypothetical protein
MTRGKKKSSGWRPAGKRRPWEQTKKLKLIAQHAHFAADSDRQGLWRSCPAALCKRKRRCAVDPYRCTKERGDNAAPRVARPKDKEPPRFAISAKDAAAIIKADVEAHIAATGNDPDGIYRG